LMQLVGVASDNTSRAIILYLTFYTLACTEEE
jgi:hypothetical protein